MAEQKRQREPWQSYFWSTLLAVVFIGGIFFTAWVWQDGQWVWIRERSPDWQAKNVLGNLLARDFARATAHFDPTLIAALPPEKLARDWVQLTSQLGALRSGVLEERLHHEPKEVRTHLLQFEHGEVRVTVTFDLNIQKVTGLCFEPVREEPASGQTRVQ